MPKLLTGFFALLVLVGLVGCSDNQAPAPTPVPTVKSVGNLPLPSGVSRLDFSVEDLKKVTSLPAGLSLAGVDVGAYNSAQSASEILKFYQTELKTQGWSPDEKRSQSNLLYFNKDNRVSTVIALPISSPSAAETLSNVIPSFKGKIKAGDNLLVLTQGPQTAFTAS